MTAPAPSPLSGASVELVRQHQLACIARLLHDEIGPTLSGVGLRLSVFEGDPDEKLELQDGLGSAIEAVRTLQYLAQTELAARFGLRRAFELLPYYAAPGFKAGVTVLIDGTPELKGQAAQELFEAAAAEVARASLVPGAGPLQVSLNGQGWMLRDLGDR